MVFVLVLVYLTYQFSIKAIQICADTVVEYCSKYVVDYYIENMTLTAFQAACVVPGVVPGIVLTPLLREPSYSPSQTPQMPIYRVRHLRIVDRVLLAGR